MWQRGNYSEVEYKYAIWADALNKASKTRDMIIQVNGIMSNFDGDLRSILSLKGVFENVADKNKTVFVDVADRWIEMFKDRGSLRRFLPERDSKDPWYKPSTWFKWKWGEKTPIYRPDGKLDGYIRRFPRTYGEKLTGLKTRMYDREGIESMINFLVEVARMVKPADGEMLKRRWLGLGSKTVTIIDPETGRETKRFYPIIPGYVPVRTFMAEALPTTFFLLSIIFAMAMFLLEDARKSLGK
jgi:hypothetical protein